MRHTLLALLALAAGAGALPDGAVTDEAHNFTVTVANTMDWKILPEDPEQKHIRARFSSPFVDSDPPASGDYTIIVWPLPKEFLKTNLDKIAAKWGSAWDGNLSNPRERTETAGKLGKGDKAVDCYTVDVQGDMDAGIHRVTYTLAKQGKFLYVHLVQRSYIAVADKQLAEEIDEIRNSFDFLRVEKVEASKEAGTDDVPVGPGAPGKKEEEKIDPEKLKSERFTFGAAELWKFECVKPDDLLNIPYDTLSESERGGNNVKLKFERARDQCRITIRIAAQTEAAKQFTIEQLMQHKLDNFKKLYEGKQAKDPEIDKNYKFPLGKDSVKSKECVRLDLVGKRALVERTIWILFESKNERQYQIEIFLQGGEAATMWKRQVDLFLKEFKTLK